MTGNDIVDIKTAASESNWKRSGFLEKIFTQQEQQYIHNALVQDEMVWKLWSMKESAYKIYTRQFGGRFFAPQKLKCLLINDTTGLVTINGISYQTLTCVEKNYIYSIARLEGCINFYSACFAMPGEQFINRQEFIYEKLINHYARIKCNSKTNFIVLKEKNNIPFLFCKKEKIKLPVSITHHGKYAAFTIK